MKTSKFRVIFSLAFCLFSVSQNAMADLASAIAEYDKGNFAVAVKEITREAEQGNAEAQILLGNIYTYGTVVEKNTAIGFGWYKKAASLGNSRGQEILGWSYLNGTGVAKDAKAAFKSFQAAANGGNKDAQYQLATMYSRGEGVTKNNELAMQWTRKSAQSHHPFALTDLGWAYQNGENVGMDKVLAFALYTVSSLYNPTTNNKAVVNRSAMANELTTIEMDRALSISCFLNNAENLIVALDAYIADGKSVPDGVCTANPVK